VGSPGFDDGGIKSRVEAASRLRGRPTGRANRPSCDTPRMTHPARPSRTAADLLVECLEAEGTEYVFSVPGEETMDILDAL